MIANTKKGCERAGGRLRRGAAPLLFLWLGVSLGGCEGLFEVDNPNNVTGDDTRKPEAATAMANGALAKVALGVSAILTSYSTGTDELTWVGSRDGYNQLDKGFVSFPFNEFIDGEFIQIASARWSAWNAVQVLDSLNQAKALKNVDDLARAYLYAAIAYTTIADMFDDFAFSDRTESGPPIGPANMAGVYDDAIGFLDKGLAIVKSSSIKLALTGMRARVKHAKAIWGLVGRQPIKTGIVGDAGAEADAKAALKLDATDWKFKFSYAPPSQVRHWMGAWVNSRQEMRLGDLYVVPTANNLRPASIRLKDPIDGIPDPAVTAIHNEFSPSVDLAPQRIVTAREMHLIIAETRLAAVDTAGFATAINNLRALDNLTPWTKPEVCLVGEAPYQAQYNGGCPTALELLIHSRTANLFIQGRRLADMYRFQIVDPTWDANSDAVKSPGSFFPITIIECRANETIDDACAPTPQGQR